MFMYHFEIVAFMNGLLINTCRHLWTLRGLREFIVLGQHWILLRLKCKDTEYWHQTEVEGPKAVNHWVPFAGGIEARAAESVPGAVGVSGEAAVSASRAVSVTTVQGDLWDPELGADVQLLL